MHRKNNSKKRLSTKKLWTFSLILSILCILITFSLAEIAFRLFSPRVSNPKKLARQSIEYVPSIFSCHVFPNKEQFVYKGNQIMYYINKWGYRGHTFEIEKPQDTTRIIFLGGSQVFDKWASRGHDWPHLIENLLLKKGINVESINAGTPGHKASDSLGKLYSEIHWFKPDYVIIDHEYNEINYFKFVSPENSMLREYKPLSITKNPFIEYTGFIDRILCTSQVYLRLREFYYQQKLRPGKEGVISKEKLASEVSPYGAQQFELTLKLLVDGVREIGAVPILLVQPRLVSIHNTPEDKRKIKYKYAGLTHEAFYKVFDQLDFVVKKVASEKNVDLFDLSFILTGKREYFHDHIHLNPEGSKVVAQALADYLEKILIKGTK